MTGLIVLGVIAVLTLALCLSRVGAAAAYEGGVVSLKLRLGVFRLRVLPEKPGKKPPKKPKPKKPEKPPKPKKPSALTPTAADLPELLKLGIDALGRLRRGILIHELYVRVVTGGEDAAENAIRYGRVNMILGACLPLLQSAFTVKRLTFLTDLDYGAGKTKVDARLSLTVRVGTLLAMAIVLGIRYWKLINRKGGVQNGKYHRRHDEHDHAETAGNGGR